METNAQILLKDVWPISDPKEYKLHFARWNGDVQPLEVWARDKQEWQGWQEYFPGRNEFNLVNDPSLAYCRANFRFALLEHRTVRTPDETVIARESFWKRILLTRGSQGLNRN